MNNPETWATILAVNTLLLIPIIWMHPARLVSWRIFGVVVYASTATYLFGLRVAGWWSATVWLGGVLQLLLQIWLMVGLLYGILRGKDRYAQRS